MSINLDSQFLNVIFQNTWIIVLSGPEKKLHLNLLLNNEINPHMHTLKWKTRSIVKCSYLYWQHKSNLGSSLLILWFLLSYSCFSFFPPPFSSSFLSPWAFLSLSSASPSSSPLPLSALVWVYFSSSNSGARCDGGMVSSTVAEGHIITCWLWGVKKGGGKKVMDGGGEIELCKCQRRKRNKTNLSRPQ